MWQYSHLYRHSIPLYAEGDCYVIGKKEKVMVSTITAVTNPPVHILELDPEMDTFNQLNSKVQCFHVS